MNNHHLSDDLLLQATQYVLEEMDVAERDLFEQFLLEDQSAREAVASAVELLAATQAAHLPLEERPTPRHPAYQPTTNQTRRLVWWISAVAACLLVAAVVLMQSRLFSPRGDIAHITPENPENGLEHGKGLAQVWARSLGDDPDREHLVRGQWWDLDLAADLTEVGPRFEGEKHEDAELEDELALAPPSWMLTALAAQQESPLPAADLTEQVEESRQ